MDLTTIQPHGGSGWLPEPNAVALSSDEVTCCHTTPKQVGPALMKWRTPWMDEEFVLTRERIGPSEKILRDVRLRKRSLPCFPYNLQFLNSEIWFGCRDGSWSGDQTTQTSVARGGVNSVSQTTHSAEPLVKQTMVSISSSLPCTNCSSERKSVLTIVESFLYAFIVEFLPQGRLRSQKEREDLTRSFTRVAETLDSVANQNNDEMTVAKYWTECELAKAFGDPQRPARPSCVKRKLFRGWCAKMLARALAKGRVSFFYSLQKGSKQSWEPITALRADAAALKNLTLFSTPRGSVEPRLRSVIVSLSRKVFGERAFSADKFLPTSSACLENTRRGGGYLATMEPAPLFHPDCDQMGWVPYVSSAVNLWRTCHYDRVSRAMNESLERENRGPQLVKTSTGYQLKRHNLGNSESVQILEPGGKARTVTLGSGELYSGLQPLQGHLLDCWKHTQYSTMLTDDLTDSVQRLYDCARPILHLFLGPPRFVSGDYESATDNEKRDATRACMEGHSGLVPPFLQQFAERSFEPGWLRSRRLYRLAQTNRAGVDREHKGRLPPLGGGEPGDQDDLGHPAAVDAGVDVWACEGQPMGHPLSFPYLCVANLATYKHALTVWTEEADDDDEWIRRSKIAQVLRENVIVNGDDILFICDITFYPVWMRVAAACGFICSVGKNYLSPDTCMINSQLFRMSKDGRVKRYGYLNQNLFRGSVKKTEGSEVTPAELARAINKTVELYPNAACAIPRMMKRASERFYGTNLRPNWYLPVRLGGMGLNPLLGPHRIVDGVPLPEKITREQRVLAGRFTSDRRIRLLTEFGSTALLAQGLSTSQLTAGRTLARLPDSVRVSVSVRKHEEILASLEMSDRERGGARHRKRWSNLRPEEVELAECCKKYIGIFDHWMAGMTSYDLPSACPSSFRSGLRNSFLELSMWTHGDLLRREKKYGTLNEKERQILDLFASVKTVVGDYVALENETELSGSSDGLSARAMLLLRMGQTELFTDVGLAVTRITRDRRYKPLSVEDIARESVARSFLVARPLPAPMPVRIPFCDDWRCLPPSGLEASVLAATGEPGMPGVPEHLWGCEEGTVECLAQNGAEIVSMVEA